MGRAQEELTTSHVAFLMTDIEGSTPLWEEDPEAMHAALARHDQILEQEVERSGGSLLTHRGEGDSAFAAFSDPGGALTCAIAIQATFALEPWSTPRPVRVRIGLHVGSALGRESDYMQPAVNRCARLRDLGAGGQILASGDCVRAIGDLPAEIGFLFLGEHVFRGLGAAIEVYQVRHPSIPADFPPIRPPAPKPAHNLPSETTSFVGRERDLENIGEILSAGKHRLITLTGAGGVGKTRLAQRAARDAVGSFEDGVFFVDLTVLAEPRLLVHLIASTVGVPREAGRRTADSLDDYLSTRSALIVLDNCEHVVEACANFAAHLLDAAPKVTLLATSREVLGVVDEQVVIVPPLDLADAGGESRGDAATLFADRAGILDSSPETSLAIDRICERLDGLPLAIELAASWASEMTPVEIAAGLADHQLRLPPSGERSGGKHETLGASVDWSYALLDERERTMFRRLGAFAGPFTVEAVATVCGDPPEAEDAAATVEALVRKSLVVPADGTRRPARYRLLETLRVYALDRLAEAGESDATRDRLAGYIEELCLVAERRLGLADREWSGRLDDERANVDATLEWTKARDPLRFMRICGALTVYWANAARNVEAKIWLSAATEIKDAPLEMTAKANLGLGYITALEFDFPGSATPLQRALELYRQLEDDRGIARALSWIGLILGFALGPRVARPMIDEALGLARQTRERFALMTALYASGLVRATYEHAPSARPLFAEAMDLARKMGDPVSVTAMTSFAGMVELFSGEYLRAFAVLQESVALGAAARAPLWSSAAMTFLGGVLDQMGRYEEAYATLEEATASSERVGHIQASRNMHWHSRLAMHRGDLDEAERLLQREFDLPTSGQFLYGMLMRVQLAEVLVEQGEFAKTIERLEKPIVRWRDDGARWALARGLLCRSKAEWGTGDRAAALATLSEAVQVGRAFGDRATIVDVVEWAAEVASFIGDHAPAAQMLGGAERIRLATGYAVYPIRRPTLGALRSRITEGLGPARSARERTVGSMISDDEALALAAAVAKSSV